MPSANAFSCLLLVQGLIGLSLLCAAAWAASVAWADARSPAVADYSAAVAQWTEAARAPFAAAQFGASAAVSFSAPGPVIALVGDASPDKPLADAAAAGLPGYAPLRFRVPAGGALLPAAGVVFSPDATVAFSFAAVAAAVPAAAAAAGPSTSSFALAPLPLFTVQRLALASKTGNQAHTCAGPGSFWGGVWTAATSTCTVVSRLVDVCVQVSQAAAPPAWAPDASRGGAGCDAATGWQIAGVYAPTFADGTNATAPFLTPVSFAGLNLTVRATADPLLAAEGLTSGGLDFGLSRADALRLFGFALGFGLLLVARPVYEYNGELRDVLVWWAALAALTVCAPCVAVFQLRRGGAGGASVGAGDHESDGGGEENESESESERVGGGSHGSRGAADVRDAPGAAFSGGRAGGAGAGAEDSEMARLRVHVDAGGRTALARPGARVDDVSIDIVDDTGADGSPRPRRSRSAGSAAAAAAVAAAAAATAALHPALAQPSPSGAEDPVAPAAASSSSFSASRAAI